MSAVESQVITQTVLGLHRWLESKRVEWPTRGYGGPVVHWWNHQLSWQGAAFDWRYEGIVAGYLTLWERTDDVEWLATAIRAGDDLVGGQLANGLFRNSRFEQNPGEGGTPHEAAADVALLRLASALREIDAATSTRFLEAARRNLERYWFGQLWDDSTSTLRDSPSTQSFVPNKAATFLEAVLLLAEFDGRGLVEHYAVATGESVLAMQLRLPGDLLDGAIAQNRFGEQIVHAYFPLYIARCIPPLFMLFERTGDPRFHDAALAAARFLERVRDEDGGFPQVLYPKGRRNRYPRWVAGAGDILRALTAANQYGAEIAVDPTIAWLLGGAREDGRIVTAEGFERILPPFTWRDRWLNEIGVAGWCDKAFRSLAEFVPHQMHDTARAEDDQHDIVRAGLR